MKSKILRAVAEVYNWLDEQNTAQATCDRCGKCCDFETFDHRLFVTSPELIYFTAKTGPLKPMPQGTCPYNIDGNCTVHRHRFAGCRIFSCKTNGQYQSPLSEEAIEKFKSICSEFNVPYCYTDLASALNGPAVRLL
jgi:hypothetical protein